MSYQMFFASDVNPNDTTGGGGCICSPVKQIDCKPPYLIFPGNDMENVASPHVVVCKSCLDAGSAALRGEILEAGERGGYEPLVLIEDDLDKKGDGPAI